MSRKKMTIIILSLFLVSIFVGNWINQDKASASHLSSSPLLTDNRSEVEICVESYVSDITTSTAKKVIDGIMKNTIVPNQKWEAMYGDYGLRIKTGCEISPYLLQEGATHPILSGKPNLGRVVTTPSSSRVTVFTVPKSVKKKYFSNSPLLTSPEEFLC